MSRGRSTSWRKWPPAAPGGAGRSYQAQKSRKGALAEGALVHKMKAQTQEETCAGQL